MSENQKDLEEYAQEYTFEEKIKFVIGGGLLGAILMSFMQFYGLPKLKEFAAISHRVSFFGFSGTELLLYGVFLGIPLVLFLSILPLIIQGYKIVRDKQFPHKGAKVMRKTKIIRGKMAVLRGYLLLAGLPGMFVGITYFALHSLNSLLK